MTIGSLAGIQLCCCNIQVYGKKLSKVLRHSAKKTQILWTLGQNTTFKILEVLFSGYGRLLTTI